MIIDITRIETVLPFDLFAEPAAIDLEGENYRLTKRLDIKGSITRHIGKITVEGNLSGAAEIDCIRCLTPIAQPVSIPFSVDFLTEGHLGSEGDHEVAVSDLDIDELNANELDLVEVAREQLLLNIPVQAFCNADCKGICSKCGENLNLVSCNCDTEEIDPRWAALKNLK